MQKVNKINMPLNGQKIDSMIKVCGYIGTFCALLGAALVSVYVNNLAFSIGLTGYILFTISTVLLGYQAIKLKQNNLLLLQFGFFCFNINGLFGFIS